MRTAELADLAGVTIRTIRHYHQIGVLPEPPRTSNGYRDYSVDHVVTLFDLYLVAIRKIRAALMHST